MEPHPAAPLRDYGRGNDSAIKRRGEHPCAAVDVPEAGGEEYAIRMTSQPLGPVKIRSELRQHVPGLEDWLSHRDLCGPLLFDYSVVNLQDGTRTRDSRIHPYAALPLSYPQTGHGINRLPIKSIPNAACQISPTRNGRKEKTMQHRGGFRPTIELGTPGNHPCGLILCFG